MARAGKGRRSPGARADLLAGRVKQTYLIDMSPRGIWAAPGDHFYLCQLGDGEWSTTVHGHLAWTTTSLRKARGTWAYWHRTNSVVGSGISVVLADGSLARVWPTNRVDALPLLAALGKLLGDK